MKRQSLFAETADRLKKGKPRLLDKDERSAHQLAVDIRENKIVKARSGGQCEVFIVGEGRCQKPAHAIHHMLGGWGRRARGESALAIRKQHVCDGPKGHHRLITGHVLRRLPADASDAFALPRWDDAYERVK